MADFDLIGKVRLQFEEQELAKLDAKLKKLVNKVSADQFERAQGRGFERAIDSAQRKAEQFVRGIERDMDRVARSANKALTKAFDIKNNTALQELKKSIFARDKFATQQGSRANLEITREETRQLKKRAAALRENILLRDKFVTTQATRANVEITRQETEQLTKQAAALRENILLRDQFTSTEAARANAEITRKETQEIDKQSAALRENILLRDRFVSAEAAKSNAAIVARETEQIERQSAALRENILLRDRFIAQEAARGNEAINRDAELRDQQRISALRNNILERDSFIADQAAQQNALITRQEEINNKKRIDGLRKSILARDALEKRIDKNKRKIPIDSDPAFQFGQQSALAFKRFAAFSIAAGGLFTLVQTLREGVSEAISFEQQLVKLAQVSNTSISALGNFRQAIDGLSVGLGVSSSDLAESAVTIRQAGFSLEETKAALDTLALTSLSPSFNDLKNTTEGLIALKSQFGTAADDFKRQFGEINAVSKAFAVESEDIVTVIRKSGGAFKVAGGNVRDLIALFTAVRSTTRESADTIATGFRTIFARLQRPQVIDELKQFNIELRNQEGNFVGPLKAIEEINRALGEVGSSGDLQFARIAEQIGGIRQISKVVPLIQQFSVAQRAANIELIGANSLAEDAEIAQQSLGNRIAKTKEQFLQFARELTISDQFKDITRGLLDLTDAFTRFASSIAPILPTLATAFAFSNVSTGARFLRGFVNKLGGGRVGDVGLEIANNPVLNGILGGVGPTRRRAFFARNIGPAAVLGGLAASATGTAIGNTNPIINRRQFLAGKSLEGAGLGFSGGALVGASIGGLPGALIGGALASAATGLHGFTSALKDAQDALEEQQFRPAIDTLTQSLSLVNAGRISPLGQKSNLQAGFDALRNRRLTATGVERDQLEGDIRQTVESLLQFIQVLSESTKTMEDFNSAGGEDAIKFVAENSVLSAKLLKNQTRRTIELLREREAVERNLVLTQEKLTSQANLIGAFGSALADATSKANDMSQRFDFIANNLLGAGAVGVQFRGVAGFQDVFSRPGKIADLGLLSGASNQAAGFLGPQFSGLGQQTIAISDILRQLPSILSEFAIRRPSGDIAESLDIFVRDRLEDIASKIPQGAITLEPIIDSIANSITSEISAQGKGQAEAIQKILDAPASFVEQIVGGSGFEQVFDLFNQAATRFTERFNSYSGQLAQLTNRELAIREQLVGNLGQFFERISQVEQIRNPRNFPIGALRQRRLQQQIALLGPNQGLANNPAAIRAQLGAVRNQILDKEAALQKSTEVNATKALIEEIIRLQGEAGGLAAAFDLAADRSDEIANKFHEIEKIQLGRDQRRQGANDFIFGDRAARNQLNLVTAATQFAALNPDAFFNPNVIADSLRPAIGDFLDRFSELEIIPGFTGRQIRQRILERGVQRGVLNPQFLDDLGEGPNAAQERLLKGIEDLALQEFQDRLLLINDERANIQLLIKGIKDSLNKFVTDLRTSLLEQQAQGTQNRLNATNAERANLQSQISQFGLIQSFGGSGTNTQNREALGLAKTFRRLQGRDTSIFRVLGDINALEGAGNQIGTGPNLDLINRLRRGSLGGFSNLIDVLSESTVAGTSRRATIPNVASADNLLRPALTSVFSDLGLSKGVRLSLSDKLAERLAGAAEPNGALEVGAVRKILIDLLKEAAETSRKEAFAARDPALRAFGGLAEQEQNFVRALVDLPEEKFKDVAKAINELGDAKLDQVTEQFNNLNREAQALTTTLQGLTGQIRALNPQPGIQGAPAAAPQVQPLFDAIEAARQILKGITDGLKDSLNGNNGITQAIQNIPRTIELAANHKVEVVINGAQVLAQLQPGLEQLVITETEKALNKFAANNLPGIGSFS